MENLRPRRGQDRSVPKQIAPRAGRRRVKKYEPRRTCPSIGALVIDDLPSKTGLILRSSRTRARIPPPREGSHIVMYAARCRMAKVLQHTTRAVTSLQREVRIDFQVASSFLPSLFILATTTLANFGATGVLAPTLPSPGSDRRSPDSDGCHTMYLRISEAACQDVLGTGLLYVGTGQESRPLGTCQVRCNHITRRPRSFPNLGLMIADYYGKSSHFSHLLPVGALEH